MKKRPSIYDAFAKVIAATEAAIIANTSINWGTIPKRVYFQDGNSIEVNSILQSYTNASIDKYPLIVLFRDIPNESIGEDLLGLTRTFKAHLAICTYTVQTYRKPERETINFIPILEPIFNEFLHQISLSMDFNMPSIKNMAVTATDCFFYGNKMNPDKNIFNDPLDAIEINSISLTLRNVLC